MPGNLPTPPESVIAQWPAPNYIDPVRKLWLKPYGITLAVVCTVLVFIRLTLRARREGGGLGLDDALLVPAWAICMGVYATAIYATEHALAGIHIWDSKLNTVEDEALNAWIGAFLFISGTCCLKVSVLLFYRRLQSGTYNRVWLFAIWAAIAFTVTYTLAMVLALILNCNPTQAYWLAYDAQWAAANDYRCADTGILNLVAGVLSIVTDLYSIALPCIVAQGLKIPLRQKIILNVMFGISLITVGSAIARTYLYYKLSYTYDFTWLAFNVYFWTMLEFGLGIICACAPSFRVFVKRYLGEKLSSIGISGDSKRHRSGSESELTPIRPPGAMAVGGSGIEKNTTFEVRTAEEGDVGRSVTSNSTFAKKLDGRRTSDSSSWVGSIPSGPRSPQEHEESMIEELRRARSSLHSNSRRRGL